MNQISSVIPFHTIQLPSGDSKIGDLFGRFVTSVSTASSRWSQEVKMATVIGVCVVAALIFKLIQIYYLRNQAVWMHLELKISNYGFDITREGEEQKLKALFETVDELIAKKGVNGTVLIADFDEDKCKFARTALRKYIKEKYPQALIVIKIIAKDYRLINQRDDLNVAKVDSIHLKNPDESDIKGFRSNQYVSKWILDLLKHSKTGISIFAVDSLLGLSCLKEGVEKCEKDLLRCVIDRGNVKNIVVDVNAYGAPCFKKIYEHKIRASLPEEMYSEEEMIIRNQEKKEIIERLNSLKSEYEEKLLEITKHEDFPLARNFIGCSTEYLIDLSPPEDVLDDLNKAQNLKEKEDYFHFCITSYYYPSAQEYLLAILSFVNKDPKTAFDKHRNSRGRNKCDYAKDFLLGDPHKFWSRLGLGSSYKEMFHLDKDFWLSKKTLKAIYYELKALGED